MAPRVGSASQRHTGAGAQAQAGDSNEDEEEDDEEDEEDEEDDDSDDSQSGCFLFLSLKCFSKCPVNQNILKRLFKSTDLKSLSFTVSCSSVPFYSEW